MSTAHKGWAVGGALMAVAIAAATTWSAGVHRAPVTGEHTAAAPAPTTAVAASPAAAERAASSAAASTMPAPPVAGTGKVLPPAVKPAQLAATRAELASLAQRLTRRVVLTPPSSWARYADTEPQYAEDVTSCPHVAGTLGRELGRSWTYAYGKLPTGPVGCAWTPAPYVPDRPPAERLFAAIGYQAGPVAELLGQAGFCAGGTTAPVLPVPAVGPGATLGGCLDGNGTQLVLSVADPAGSGVWTLSASGGTAQPAARAAAALLAVVDGARTAYA